MILIGTSGFSYDDWKGFFYPNNCKKSDMLAHYAKQFSVVEINSTYYTIPGAASFQSMVEKTPSEFKFTVKAHRNITHAESTDLNSLKMFIAAIQPIADNGKLGCILAQYPWGFKPSEENRSRLYELRENFGELPVVVELRNSEWVKPETFGLLQKLGLGFCSVDEPDLKGLMPRSAELTSRIGYVRFHGRNNAQWWNHEHAWQRYDYLYSADELSEWMPRIQSIASKAEVTYLFFNNHYQGKAAKNAKMLADMLSLQLNDVIPEQLDLF